MKIRTLTKREKRTSIKVLDKLLDQNPDLPDEEETAIVGAVLNTVAGNPAPAADAQAAKNQPKQNPTSNVKRS